LVDVETNSESDLDDADGSLMNVIIQITEMTRNKRRPQLFDQVFVVADTGRAGDADPVCRRSYRRR
jgi:hypothetical protein